jgi:uncharacterized protein with von Willebrand factor type A (vWA) domain
MVTHLAEADPVRHAALFARALRAEGLLVGSGQLIDFCRAAATVEPADLYWAGLATLVVAREQIAVYDRVFTAFFAGDPTEAESDAVEEPAPQPQLMVRCPPPESLGEATDEEEEADQELALASAIELVRHKSFAEYTDAELQALLALGSRLVTPTRRSRRCRATRAGLPDFRATLRASFRTGTEPVNRMWRSRRQRPRRVILLLDVSGSMTAYSRALLYFAQAGVRTQRDWEVFCFATRLTRITRALGRGGTPDEALARAAEEVVDFDGGTRIGDSLKDFLDSYGHGGLARGACVLICSDGLEFGDPELLRAQMVRLSRLAHRVGWLNPLREDPEYEPLARGMRAALPHVDVFEGAHNLDSLVEGMTQMLGERRRPPSR